MDNQKIMSGITKSVPGIRVKCIYNKYLMIKYIHDKTSRALHQYTQLKPKVPVMDVQVPVLTYLLEDKVPSLYQPRKLFLKLGRVVAAQQR